MKGSRKQPFYVKLRAAIMRAVFGLLYNNMAWTYDLVAAVVSLGMWKDWVLAVVPFLHGPRVLELGHGPGHLQIALQAEHGLVAEDFKVFGLDISVHMSRMAWERLYKHGFQPALTNANAHKLPFPAETFDQVVATFPSEYIYNMETLEEVERVLVPGGSLVILPLAWITGRRLHERAAAGLFRITGQAPEWDDRYLEPAGRVGFQVKVDRVPMRGSLLLVIRVIKPFNEAGEEVRL